MSFEGDNNSGERIEKMGGDVRSEESVEDIRNALPLEIALIFNKMRTMYSFILDCDEFIVVEFTEISVFNMRRT
jgi:hypothetical protein